MTPAASGDWECAGYDQSAEAAPAPATTDWSLYRGSLRVMAEIRNLLETSHVADRAMMEHWSDLLAKELSDELRAKLPALTKQLAALDKAKRVSRETLDAVVRGGSNG